MYSNDLTANQYRQQLLKGSEEYILDFLHKSKKPSGFLGETKPSTAAYINVREERRRVSTTKSPTRLTYAGSLFYNLVGTYTITRILGNYGTAKGIAYFIEDKEHLYSKYPCILYREELDVEYYGNTNKVRAVKEYLYSLEQNKIVKYFVNENNHALFYQMHFISNNPCQAEAIHQCNLDIYQASYIFLNEDYFELSYKILGPSKDYTIKTSFTRLCA